MAATLTRGYTFGATEQVTNTKLHTLVDSGSVSGVDENALASGKGLVVRSTSAPSATGSIWIDTNFSNPVVKSYSGAAWVPAGPFAILTNKSGSQRVAGDVVVAYTSADSSFTTTTTAGDGTVVGVVMETIANNSTGVVALPGAICTITVDGSTTRGQFLKASGTAAKATPSTSTAAGAFAIALTASATSVTAILTGVSNSAASASQAEMEAVSSTSVMGTPGNLKWHPGVAKGWCYFNGTTTGTHAVTVGYNITNVTRNSAGNYTITFDTAFSSANFCVIALPGNPGTNVFARGKPATTTTATIEVVNTANAAVDADNVGVVAFGDL